MHICFIEDTYLHGGTQIWVSEAMRVFMAAGHDVTLLTTADGFNATDAVGTDARLVTYDFEGVTAQDARHRRIWTDALEPADLAICTIHPPRDGFHCSRFAAACIADAGLETILQPKTGTIMPDYVREYYAPPEDIRYHVICITDFTRQYLIDTHGVPTERISLIYQGTDLTAFTPDESRAERARERYPVPAGATPVLGNVGSFEHRKGQFILLDAVAQARDRMPDLHLMLVGDGPDEEPLKARVRELGLDEHVSFHPFTRQPAEVFEVIDLLVLASTYKEGLPNVLLEALAMGVPVVSTRLAGTPEVVHHGTTGLLVELGNVDELAAALADLGSDPQARERMGQAGQRLMNEQFDKDLQFKAFLDHFEWVVTQFGD